MAEPCWELPLWSTLKADAETMKSDEFHLRKLLQDADRCAKLTAEFDGIFVDYSRQKMTEEVRGKLFELARATKVEEKIKAMKDGQKINLTEDRAVMHIALRAPKDATLMVDGANVVTEVHDVLDKIYKFTADVREGRFLGATSKELKNVVSIGIGGSYLGPEFVFEALKMETQGYSAAKGRTLRFLANVDPVDVSRALEGLSPESTLVVVVSKTFTTAETMLNAKTLREWLLKGADANNVEHKTMIAKHMVAVSANVEGAKSFGIDAENVFGFWDWVGGRYSVCSAVGMLPLTLQYGKGVMQDFLDGAHAMDEHFLSAPLEQNLPAILGILGVWNSTFLGLSVRALLPYSQALLRFPAHIQQVDMESNGKRVTLDGKMLPFNAGEVNFGEPGTNGQHSFYQLIHQGRVMACDFIGSVKSQCPRELEGEPVSNHDELMSNFFAQPDALACGKTIEDLKAEGVAEKLWPHKEFPGDRPSTSILFPKFNAKRIGQLLALYEHRTGVQGFIWGIASFDQWGVELGKVLAKQVRSQLGATRKSGAAIEGFNPSTTSLLKRFVE